MNDGLVSTEWLGANLDAPDLRVVDGSWHLPGSGRSARAEYADCHIPEAVFFDIDEIADDQSTLPHMLPPAEKFASSVRQLGLGDGNRIVVYDSVGLMSAARVWWMFRVFGHESVAVLDGGFPKWRAEGRRVSDAPSGIAAARQFTARTNGLLVRDLGQVLEAVGDGSEQIVDARSVGRFRGEEPEPRKGLRGGHIPGARNLPYQRLFAEDGTMLPADGIRARFEEAGVDTSRAIVTSCGSGVTAAILTLALGRLGHSANALYDGSWAEWGQLKSRTPVATGQ